MERCKKNNMEDLSKFSGDQETGDTAPEPGTRNPELSTCPRCGKEFHCSKSGKCWCYEVMLPLDKLEEIENLYETCLCPTCLKEFAGSPRQADGKYSRNQFIYVRKPKQGKT